MPPPDAGDSRQELSPAAAGDHLETCPECREKVSKYRQFVNQAVWMRDPLRRSDCPQGVDWYEVSVGLVPELKAKQLVMHAALCDHCGPLLRATARLNTDPTPQEEKLLAKLKTPSRPGSGVLVLPSLPSLFTRWLVPVAALIVIVGMMLRIIPSQLSAPLDGPQFAELAVGTEQQYALGKLPLEVRSNSQQTINEWFKQKSPFSVALPATTPVPGEQRPYRLEGARLVPLNGKTAAFIAYQVLTPGMLPTAASLMVTPDSVAAASGGVAVNFKKLSFHYATVRGYKVVTWSQHGLTYALVSQESHNTQGSCMVCHSAMGDRDLTQTPTPLYSAPQQILQ